MNISMLLRYFWMAGVSVAPMVIVSVAALDFYDVSQGQSVPCSPNK